MTLRFNTAQRQYSFIVKERPTFLVDKISLVSNDDLWTTKLFNASLHISIKGYNKEGRELSSIRRPFSIGSLIGPYTHSRNLRADWYIPFEIDMDFYPTSQYDYWDIQIEVVGADLRENEALEIEYYLVEKQHVERRISDWKSRLDGLYQLIAEWGREIEGLFVRGGKAVVMHEAFMKDFDLLPAWMPTLDLFLDGSLIFTVRPKGLWIIGTNGRVDLLSKKTSYIVVDFAFLFEPPEWSLIPFSDRQRSQPFTAEVFKELIRSYEHI